MRCALIVFAIALGGCTESVVTQLDLLDDTESVVFSRDGCGGDDQRELLALPTEGLRFDFAYCENQQVALHEYDVALDTLCLQEGRLIPFDGADQLAIPHRAQSGVVIDDEVRWMKLASDERSITAPVVPRIDVLACASAERCIGEGDACVCTQACATPERLQLEEVALPSAECPSGWLAATPRPQLRVCRAYDAAVDCPAGEVALPGRGCVRLRSACAGDGWPAASADTFVRSGATDGDGTRAAPYGDLEAALNVVPPGGVIALASGTYTLPSIQGGHFSLIGACADEVLLEMDGARQLGASALEIEDVTLVLGATLNVLETTTATLTRVVVEGGGGINVRGYAMVQDAELSSLLRVVGAARVRGSWLTGGVTVRSGALQVSGSSVVTDDRVALSSGLASTLHLDHSRVASSSIALQAIQGGELRVTASEIDGPTNVFTDSAVIERTYMRGGAQASTLGRCNSDVDEADLTDVVLESTNEDIEALVVFCSEMTRFNRVATFGGRALRVSVANVRLQDVRIFDSTLHGVQLQGSKSANLTRVHVSDVARVGVAVDDNWDSRLQGGFHEIRGLFVERATEAAVRFDDSEGVWLSDVHIVEARGDGIVVAPNSVQESMWQFDHVFIDGADGSEACEEAVNRACAGAGILVDGDFGDTSVYFEFEDLEVASAQTALHILGILDLAMTRVLFRGSRVGVYALTPNVPARTFVTDVTYRDNETTIIFGD